MNSHQKQNHGPRHWYTKPPEIRITVLQHGHIFEIHPEIARQECHGQEKDRDEGELLHALVLIGAHGVENQVDHAVCGAAHAL